MRQESRHKYGAGNRALIAALVLSFIACFVVFAGHAQAAALVGKITNMEGTVDVLRGGALPGIPLNPDDPVYVKDVIRTKSNGKAEITFDDGNIVKVAPGSRIDITDYVAEEGKNRAVIKMPRGKAQALVNKDLVKKLSISQKASNFEIHTPNAVVGVRGTDFLTQTGSIQGVPFTNVMVREGIVATYNPSMPQNIVMVNAGQATTIPFNKPPQTPAKMAEQVLKAQEKDTTLKEKPKTEDKTKEGDKPKDTGKPGDKPADKPKEAPKGPAGPRSEVRPGGPMAGPGGPMAGPGGPMAGPGGPMAGPGGPMAGPGGPMAGPGGPMAGPGGPMAGPGEPMTGPGGPMAGPGGPMAGPGGPMAGPGGPMMGPGGPMMGPGGLPVGPMGSPTGPMGVPTGPIAGTMIGSGYAPTPGMMPGTAPMPGTYAMPGMMPGMPGAPMMGPDPMMGGMAPTPGMMPGMTMPGMTMPGMTMPGMTMPGMTMPGMTMPGTYAMPAMYTMPATYTPTPTYIPITNYAPSLIGTTTTNFYGNLLSNSNYDFITTSAFSISGILNGSATTGITMNELSGPINFTISPYSNPTAKKIWATDLTGNTGSGGAFVGFAGSTTPASPGKGGYVALYAEGGMLGIIEGTYSDYLDPTATMVNASGTGNVHLIPGSGITFAPTIAGLQAAMISSPNSGVPGSDYGFKISVPNNFEILLGNPSTSSVSYKQFEKTISTPTTTVGIRMRFEAGTFSLTDYIAGRNGYISTSAYMGDRSSSRYSVGLANINNDPGFGLLSADYKSDSIMFDTTNNHYSLGTEGGHFNAKYSGGSYYAVEVGGFQGSPMMFANSLNASAYYSGTSEGTLSAFMGGTNAFWYGGARFTIIGATTGMVPGLGGVPGTRKGQTWMTAISSPVISNAAYNGFLSGITRYTPQSSANYSYSAGGVNNHIEGLIHALYIAPSGDVGIMSGDFGVPGINKGDLFTDIGMFEAEGWANTISMTTTASPASSLSSLTKSADFNYYYLSQNSGFWDASYGMTGSITSSTSNTQNIKWITDGAGSALGRMGVWKTDDYGSYSNPGGSNNGWAKDLTGWQTAPSGYAVGALIEGGPWGYKNTVSYTAAGPVYATSPTENRFEGNVYGYWADSGTRGPDMTTPMTAIMAGKLVGVFDPAASTYQAVASGSWIETAKLIQMLGCSDAACATWSGYNNADSKLYQFNVPSVIVGKTNLSGASASGNLNVTMNNVVFLAPAGGTAPKIWATGNVSGSYAADPLTQTANLSGGGISAQFAPKQWTGNKWLATVDGSIPASTMNNASGALMMKGAAAGTYTGGSAAGTFSGTAAGIVKK